GKVELGIVTIGAVGLSISATLLSVVGWSIEPPTADSLKQTAIRRNAELTEAREKAEKKRIEKRNSRAPKLAPHDPTIPPADHVLDPNGFPVAEAPVAVPKSH